MTNNLASYKENTPQGGVFLIVDIREPKEAQTYLMRPQATLGPELPAGCDL
jgi:hypothetical protein